MKVNELNAELTAVKQEGVLTGLLQASNEFLCLPKIRTAYKQLTHIGAWAGEYVKLLNEQFQFNEVNLTESLARPAKTAKAEHVLIVSDRNRGDNQVSYYPSLSRVTTETIDLQNELLKTTVVEKVANVKKISELIVSRSAWFSPESMVVLSTGRISCEALMALFYSKFFPGIIQVDVYRRNYYSGFLNDIAKFGYTVPDEFAFEQDDGYVTIIISREGKSALIRNKMSTGKAGLVSKLSALKNTLQPKY